MNCFLVYIVGAWWLALVSEGRQHDARSEKTTRPRPFNKTEVTPAPSLVTQAEFEPTKRPVLPRRKPGTTFKPRGSPSLTRPIAPTYPPFVEPVCIPPLNSSILYDVNKDGKENTDDLIYVLRTISDPLNQLTQGNLTADVNNDGVVDISDADFLINYLLTKFGPPCLPGYGTSESYDWSQLPLTARRELSADRDQDLDSAGVPPFMLDQDRDLQAMQCGTSPYGSYSKGSGPKPVIKWDNGFSYDPNVKPTWKDYRNWVVFGGLLSGAFITIPDGARANSHYRDATGTDLNVDYDKAYNDDSLIKSGVDNEIQAVTTAVQQMFNGKEASFQFYSTKARVVNSATMNWQYALGGHDIWSTGTVTYSTSPCQLSVEITINMEDFYNFNHGQQDITFGIPDNINGRFEVFGWAKSFYSRGKITRTKTIPLQCCVDSDCPNSNYVCQCNLCTVQCPTNQFSGGQGHQSFTVELFKSQGTVTVSYDTYTIPDAIDLYYEGTNIFSTHGLVSASNTLNVAFGSSTSKTTFITAVIDAPLDGTAWQLSISCPK